MARNIQTGIEQLAESMARNVSNDISKQWRDIRNKIDSILLSTTVIKTDEIRRSCQELDDMAAADRPAYIGSKWGPAYLERIEPLLQQLQILETRMAKDQ